VGSLIAYFNLAKARIEMTARGRGPSPLYFHFRVHPLDPQKPSGRFNLAISAYFNLAKARIEMTARGRGPNPPYFPYYVRPLDPLDGFCG
jgi:hypothetical protein